MYAPSCASEAHGGHIKGSDRSGRFSSFPSTQFCQGTYFSVCFPLPIKTPPEQSPEEVAHASTHGCQWRPCKIRTFQIYIGPGSDPTMFDSDPNPTKAHLLSPNQLQQQLGRETYLLPATIV
ncbi:hypothetical protein O6P43_010114 [Quillaja saponaria]|uniref:Uncharacterized protein n=1 Tax=Quillaja saponaria TaxID=32244 RepID=A0AAD7PZN6_QUISA|nr:hypothetical protein O6P43_010114 [Quillaja saponaria]